MLASYSNSFALQVLMSQNKKQKYGLAIFPASTLLNHSCNPNTTVVTQKNVQVRPFLSRKYYGFCHIIFPFVSSFVSEIFWPLSQNYGAKSNHQTIFFAYKLHISFQVTVASKRIFPGEEICHIYQGSIDQVPTLLYLLHT